VIAAVMTIEHDIALLERVPILRRLGAGALIGTLRLLFGMRWLRFAPSPFYWIGSHSSPSRSSSADAAQL
jgi:hypothetical protein